MKSGDEYEIFSRRLITWNVRIENPDSGVKRQYLKPRDPAKGERRGLHASSAALGKAACESEGGDRGVSFL